MINPLQNLRGLGLEGLFHLRPPYPPVALQLDREGIALVRLKHRRRGLPLLEAHRVRTMPVDNVPASIFQPRAAPAEELVPPLRELFELTGTRPGRVSLVIPDNLAKITLLRLPERPSSRKQLDELVRSQMRRAVPFKLDEASLSYQVLPAEGTGIAVLVVLVRRTLIEQYETALESIGARVGLVDLCTTNLINLSRERMRQAADDGGDVALLNCARNYFSLAILRNERLIFFRCKSYAIDDADPKGPNGVLVREISNSLSYYQEKLEGQGIGAVFVRSVAVPVEEIGRRLTEMGVARVETVDPSIALELTNGNRLDPEVGQRIAPAIGAAAGRR